MNLSSTMNDSLPREGVSRRSGSIEVNRRYLKDWITDSPAVRILPTTFFNFFCYLSIGLLLATLPGFVHHQLGLSPFWAGLAVSSQYLATLVTRPKAGSMTDLMGPRKTVLLGQMAGLLSGLCLIAAAALKSKTMACFTVLLISRLILGCGESCIATGSTTWGLGRAAPGYAAQTISWSGIASYGAMAAGAPIGIWLEARHGIGSIGMAVSVVFLLSLAGALPLPGVPIVHAARLPVLKVLSKVLLHGLVLAFATVGFAAIASFVTLYYASRQWTDPAHALVVFGSCFVVTRALFASTINRWDGFRVAALSLIVESVGLFILWLSTTPEMALVGAALSGSGFALVFPALGVEVVKTIADQNRGSALGVFTAFLDLAMGVTGPIAGLIVGRFGYSAVFLYGSGSAICAFVLTLFLYHLVREERASQRASRLLET
jgi:predicted MFS family arabinose efflux permease